MDPRTYEDGHVVPVDLVVEVGLAQQQRNVLGLGRRRRERLHRDLTFVARAETGERSAAYASPSTAPRTPRLSMIERTAAPIVGP